MCVETSDVCPDCENRFLLLSEDDEFEHEYYLHCPDCHNQIWVGEFYFDDDDE